jgi:hypothetical protein
VSKLILFDFNCPKDGLFEDMVNPEVRQVPCPKCGLASSRQLSAVRIGHMQMALSDSASPESIAKFDRAHRQQKEKEERSEREHGPMEYGPAPGAD